MGEHYKYTNIGQLHGDEYGKQTHMLVDTTRAPRHVPKPVTVHLKLANDRDRPNTWVLYG